MDKKLFEPIITNPLDTDLYKITMGQGAYQRFPDIVAEYRFFNRGKTAFPDEFGLALDDQIKMMSGFKPRGVDYLQKRCYYLAPWYLDWLENYQFDPKEVTVRQTGTDLDVHIKGPWYRTIYWEVPLMATISEMYFIMTEQVPTKDYHREAYNKGKTLKDAGALTIDFATRRRFSKLVHTAVLAEFIEGASLAEWGGVLLGTSNVELAERFDLVPMGTYAHEWVEVMAARYGYKMANYMAMKIWSEEFHGYLGTALTDTFTTEVFLRDFVGEWPRLFDGVRQDSGDPFSSIDRMVLHYLSDHVRPVTKNIVHSNELNVPLILRLLDYNKKRTGSVFGYGTNFSNDVGVKPLNIVVKLVAVILPDGRRIPVVKLSDDPGKVTGDLTVVNLVKTELGIA